MSKRGEGLKRALGRASLTHGYEYASAGHVLRALVEHLGLSWADYEWTMERLAWHDAIATILEAAEISDD